MNCFYFQEHPNMDPNLISALSIARRVLDPLGELIKVSNSVQQSALAIKSTAYFNFK